MVAIPLRETVFTYLTDRPQILHLTLFSSVPFGIKIAVCQRVLPAINQKLLDIPAFLESLIGFHAL